MHIEYLYNTKYTTHFKKRGTQILLAMYNLDLTNEYSAYLYKKIDRENYMVLYLDFGTRYDIKGYLIFNKFSKNKISTISNPYYETIKLDYMANIDRAQGVYFNNFIDEIFNESSFVEILHNDKYSSYFTMDEIFKMNEEFKSYNNSNGKYSDFKNIKKKYLDKMENRKLELSSSKDIDRLKEMLGSERNPINKLLWIEKNIFKMINAYYNKQYNNMRQLFYRYKNI